MARACDVIAHAFWCNLYLTNQTVTQLTHLFQNLEIMLCLTPSGDVYVFVPNIVQSTLFSEQHSLFDARDNNKSNQTYFYKNLV